MFRDDEIKYVVASVVLAWIIAILVGYYEIFINRADSVPATAVAVMIGAAGATGFTLLLVGTWEVFSMLARRINERRLGEAREEGIEIGMEKGIEMGVEIGVEKGRAEGREEGRVEGREEGRAEERQRLREWYANLSAESKKRVPPPFLGGSLWCSTAGSTRENWRLHAKKAIVKAFYLASKKPLRKSKGCGGGGRQRPSLWPKRTRRLQDWYANLPSED